MQNEGAGSYDDAEKGKKHNVLYTVQRSQLEPQSAFFTDY
jgi:hypothetical protein